MPKVKKNKGKTSPQKLNIVSKIQKRDGSIVPFDIEKIFMAAYKAMLVTGEGGEEDARVVANKVYAGLAKITRTYKNFIPTVEGVQDEVERELILNNYVNTAKSYILYRQERAILRSKITIPKGVKTLVQESSKYFTNPYAEFIFYRTYSRWIPELGRRETWVETINRYMDFMKEKLGKKLTNREYNEIKKGILEQDICPSMRLLWSAGLAARKSNVWAYNCSYIAPTKLKDFGEIMYILMCGAGLGFTTESENVHKLPQIKKQKGGKIKKHVIGDDKEGWADAFVLGLKTWYNGGDIEFDYSKIRPAGARLVTAGGRASGPDPLVNLMTFARSKILAKQGKRLSNINVHDMVCKIGEIVVAGGVRRSALISLSELEDTEMRDAKKGQFYISDPQRSLSNNSTIYDSRPTAEEFLDEWTALVKSKSGERGIFNRGSLLKQIPERRRKTWEEQEQPGVNPCGEILLRSKQFCNLTSIVVRKGDTLADMKRKIRLATILGTYQASLTDFGYLSKKWKKNCQEEALLGVSITGYYDNELVRTDGVLNKLRDYSVEVNKRYAKKVGVTQSASITCVKPHGNSSQLLDTASGMHPRFAKYYIRRVRINHTDPLLQLAKDQGVPCYPEVGQSKEHATAFVLEFPVKSPKGSIVKDDISALDLLEEWKRLKENFTEHNPSATIYVSDNEWMEVSNFVYENWEVIGGLTFLPRSDHIYQLAPYEEISKNEYNRKIKEIGKLDFSKLMQYESQDNTQGSKEYACVGGLCEFDDLDVVDLAKKRATS